MEELIALVAASFARNGIECTTRKQVEKQPTRVGTAAPERSSTTTELAALPDHNYRKICKATVAPELVPSPSPAEDAASPFETSLFSWNLKTLSL
jgi:hypothetical protein